MSFSRRKSVVRRCSSSIPSAKDLQRHSGVERGSATNSKEEQVNNNVLDQRSKNRFSETPLSTEIIPDEEKLHVKNCQNRELATDSWQTYRSGLLIEDAGILTDHHNREIFDDEVGDKRMLTKEHSKDDCYFTYPMISENVDGRRSRQGFTKNSYSFSDELAPRKDNRYDIPADKLNSFIPFNYGVIPRPKRGTSRKKYSGNNQTRANDIRRILQDDISARAVCQPRRSLSAASYNSKPWPKKNNFLTNSENGDDFSIAEDIHLVLGDSIPAQQSRTSISFSGGTIPRPKKKDSTRKPNFTDNIMQSRDIDEIIEEEFGNFDLTEKMYSKRRTVPRPKRGFYQKPKFAQDIELEKDIEYILSDNVSNEPVFRPQKKNSTRKINCDDDIKGAKNMDTIMEEEVEEFDSRNMTGVPKYSAERRDSDFFLTKKMYCCSQKGTPLKSTSETRDSNNLLTNEHARDKAIDKRLEIPGFDSNGSSKGKTEKIRFDGFAEQKSKQRDVPAGSRGTGKKRPEDYTIEELVAELFPELLADVLPLDVPYVEFPDASVQPLNRDSACSVTDGDDLRPMAAGLSKVTSVPSRSRGSRTCAEKWTSGVIYTNEELKLMAEIERDYSVRGH